MRGQSLRILYCSQSYCPHDHRFLTALSGSQHSVFWFYLDGGDHTQEERDLPENIQIVKWDQKEGSFRWMDYFKKKKEFAAIVDEIQPDLIHAGPVQTVALLPALISFHPLLTMSWGFDLVEDAHRDFFWKTATQYVLNRSDWMIADCQTVKEIAIRFGFPEKRVSVFPWGVDLQRFSPSGKQKARATLGYADEFLIVHTRSWEPRYGVDIALRGFEIAAKQIPNAHMIMLGGGSQEKMVRDFVASRGLENRIHFRGYQKNEVLADYYRAADAYLSASHTDGSSVALLESMACGCPPIVSDIPSNLEWVSDGVEGWVFVDGNARNLAEQILQAAEKTRERHKFGRRARKKIEEKANWNTGVKKLLDTYQQVVAVHNVEHRQAGKR